MKKLCYFILIACVLQSCQDNESTSATGLQKAIATIEANSVMIDNAFDATTLLLKDHATVKTKADAAISRNNYIQSMESLTASVVNNSIDKTATTVGWKNAVFVYDKETNGVLKTFLNRIPVGIEGPNPGTGVLDNFSKAIDDTLARMELQNVIVSSYSTSGHAGTSDAAPTVNDVIVMKSNLEALIMKHPGQKELLDAIEDFVKAKPNAELLVRLVLPMLKRITEHNVGTKTSYQKMNDVLFGTELTADRQIWNQKMRRAALLSAIAVMLTPDYEEGRDENYACVVPQVAVYNGVTVLAWARAYDVNQ